MISSTTNKKSIIEYLNEWAEDKGDWGKLLIDKIIENEQPLSDEDRNDVFNYFLQSIDLQSDLPPIPIKNFNYNISSNKIELLTLSEVEGVNNLSPNQEIKFAKNITVVYGKNGTGKTGYSRILKSIGICYDSNNGILPNIYEIEQPKKAKIFYKDNDETKTYIWNGEKNNTELCNMSIYTSDCVKYSLSEKKISVTPKGFNLFELVSSELDRLKDMTEEKIISYSSEINWLSSLNQGTEQYDFISTLSEASDISKFNDISFFTEDNEKELIEKKNTIEKLNIDLLQKEINELNMYIDELNKNISRISKSAEYFSKDKLDKIISLNNQLNDLKSQEMISLKDILNKYKIECHNSMEFEIFLKSADVYLKKINKSDYPTDNDKCIYCNQTLNKEAHELLESYRNLLNNETQTLISKIQVEKDSILNEIFSLDYKLEFHQPIFGTDEKSNITQPREISDFNEKIINYKKIIKSENINKDEIFVIDFDKYLLFFDDKVGEVVAKKDEKNEILQNLPYKENELKKTIYTLNDRKFLSNKKDEVFKTIENHIIKAKLQSNLKHFNTQSITRKQTEARDMLIKKDFQNIFSKEIQALSKSDIPIEINFSSDKGSSKISPNIKSHSLMEILSDGEQKSISLSEFLTEIQLDNTNAPVIFDDPVSSLDQDNINNVAKRLIELSMDRQVIIFTHSIIFYSSLKQKINNELYPNLGKLFYHIKCENKKIGIVDVEDELNNIQYHIKSINKLLNNTSTNRPEKDVVQEAYGHLRSAIELLVECDILNETVRRYRNDVSINRFKKIKGDSLENHKLDLIFIFEKSCSYINSHSQPEGIDPNPTLEEFKNDFESFNKIRDVFIKK